MRLNKIPLKAKKTMEIDQLRDYCLEKKSTTESTPFGPDTLVFKVKNKIFCTFRMSNFLSVNLKCDPEKAIELRERYYAVEPGYHMNKKHWNTITIGEDLSPELLLDLIDHSYELVMRSLPKNKKVR